MPFTAAHPAAVLLLKDRLLLPWSALVIGSITPDLHYFLIGVVRGNSHTVAGLLTFNLPAGLLTWMAFHLVIKRPITRLVPDAFLPTLWGLATRKIAWSASLVVRAAIAVVVGAASHLLWDSFTHQEGWVVRHSYTLSHGVVQINGYPLSVFAFLQHASTVAGMLLLAATFVVWYRRQPRPPTDLPLPLSARVRVAILATIAIATTVPAFVYAAARAWPIADYHTLRDFVWYFIISGLGYGSLAVMLYSAGMTIVALMVSASPPTASAPDSPRRRRR
jgi:hypothetical protein